MSKIPDDIRDYLRDFRYGFTLVCVFVLGLLLFFNSLPIKLREIFIPSLAVFTIGTGLIAKVQILLTVSENTKALAEKRQPRGIKEIHLNIIIGAYFLWFVLFIVYNICKSII